MIDKTFASSCIDEFLAFLREADSIYRQAEATEQEAHNETQDLLHTIELVSCADDEMLELARRFKSVRQDRRASKDAMDMLLAVKEWSEANRPVIKSLEQLLGKVRKAEKNTDNRIYTFKSDKNQG